MSKGNEPATQECSHCGAKAGPTWTSWQCCRYPFGSCDGVMKPLTRPEPEPGDRERAEALAERIYALRGENFILGAHKGGDCYRETCDCIANDLAALLAQVRAEERERCAKVAESLYGKTYWDDPVAGIAAAIRRGEP